MNAILISSIVVALVIPSSVSAAYVITVGDFNLQPNQSDQQVSLFIENTGGSSDYGGLNFSILVGDGLSGPAITGVNLLTGTPFEAANFGGQFADGANTPRQQFWSVASLSAVLPAGQSRLATLTFDTTGLTPGSWSLNLFGSGMPSTALFDYTASEYTALFENGTLTVVPEPETYGLLAAAGLMGFALWRRHAGLGRLE